MRWLGLVGVAALAGGIIAYKSLVRPQGPVEHVAAATATLPSILLFADPREAGESCGCGQIIRMVRASASKGASVREVDPAKEPEVARRYSVAVAPAVLVLGPGGEVVERLVGESAETIVSIQVALARLEKIKP